MTKTTTTRGNKMKCLAIIPLLLAAMVAGSPVDTFYVSEGDQKWKMWTREDGAQCTSGPEPIGDELCVVFKPAREDSVTPRQ